MMPFFKSKEASGARDGERVASLLLSIENMHLRDYLADAIPESAKLQPYTRGYIFLLCRYYDDVLTQQKRTVSKELEKIALDTYGYPDTRLQQLFKVIAGAEVTSEIQEHIRVKLRDTLKMETIQGSSRTFLQSLR